MTDESTRVPVQGDGPYWLSPDHPARQGTNTHCPGSVSMEEHVEAWRAYESEYHSGQSAQRIAERGGFSYFELCNFLGHAPTTFEAQP